MDTIIVDCTSGDVTQRTLTVDEEASHRALQEQTQAVAQTRLETKTQEAQQRADAVLAVLNSPAVSADPVLRDALALLLNPTVSGR